MSDLVISLSTIPPRMGMIGPTLRDLVAQNARVADIRLYIPRSYRRFEFDPATDLPDVPSGVTICMVDDDFGPATKVLHAVRDFAGQDVEILFCDDDQPYEPDWAQRFLDQRARHPDACIVEKGHDIDTRPPGERYRGQDRPQPRAKARKKDLAYRLFRLLTLLTIKPKPYVADGFVDILEGYRGALIRPDFIPPEAFDIPDILWTVDDPWLSGHMTRNGVPIWLMTNPPLWGKPHSAHFTESLAALIHADHGRIDSDSACIAYFRDTYGIWPGDGPY